MPRKMSRDTEEMRKGVLILLRELKPNNRLRDITGLTEAAAQSEDWEQENDARTQRTKPAFPDPGQEHRKRPRTGRSAFLAAVAMFCMCVHCESNKY